MEHLQNGVGRLDEPPIQHVPLVLEFKNVLVALKWKAIGVYVSAPY